MLRRSRALALAGAAVAAPLRIGAQPNPDRVAVALISPSAPELPLDIAQRRGFFSSAGLDVQFVVAGSPPGALATAATGSAAFVVASTDSAMAAISHGLPLKLIAPVLQVDPYTLCTVPDVTDWAQLKGKKVALGQRLDVAGITFRAMAAAHGLGLDDFEVIISPSTTTRYAALLSGNVQATVLNQPFDLVAESKGMHRLAAAPNYVKNWVFDAIVANVPWLAAHRAEAQRFLRAFAQAIEYGYEHPDDAAAVLVAATRVSADVARRTYDLNWRQWHGFAPNLRFDLAGLEAVERAAVASGALGAALPLTTFYDPSVAAEALRSG